jgi:anaerobic ribonucleoside-triphosphate reductase activating protein
MRCLCGNDPNLIRVATFVPSTPSEGPGLRATLWVQGCSLHCPGCCNPEMQSRSEGRLLPVTTVVSWLEAALPLGIEGLTIIGGEPFDQAEAVGAVAEEAQRLGLGVMTFTGYELMSLRRRPDAQRLLAATDLLIDGPFIQRLRSDRRRWIGSENQKMHHLTDRYKHHPDVLEETSGQSMHLAFDPETGDVVATGWPPLIELFFFKSD